MQTRRCRRCRHCCWAFLLSLAILLALAPVYHVICIAIRKHMAWACGSGLQQQLCWRTKLVWKQPNSPIATHVFGPQRMILGSPYLQNSKMTGIKHIVAGFHSSLLSGRPTLPTLTPIHRYVPSCTAFFCASAVCLVLMRARAVLSPGLPLKAVLVPCMNNGFHSTDIPFLAGTATRYSGKTKYCFWSPPSHITKKQEIPASLCVVRTKSWLTAMLDAQPCRSTEGKNAPFTAACMLCTASSPKASCNILDSVEAHRCICPSKSFCSVGVTTSFDLYGALCRPPSAFLFFDCRVPYIAALPCLIGTTPGRSPLPCWIRATLPRSAICATL